MSLTKLSLAGNYITFFTVYPGREKLNYSRPVRVCVSDIPAGDGKTASFFFTVYRHSPCIITHTYQGRSETAESIVLIPVKNRAVWKPRYQATEFKIWSGDCLRLYLHALASQDTSRFRQLRPNLIQKLPPRTNLGYKRAVFWVKT